MSRLPHNIYKKHGISFALCRRISGFIFLIILIYLTLISLVSITNIMQIKQDLHLQNQILRNERRLIVARLFIRELEQQVDRNCFNGCSRAGYQYKYEALGQDPCAVISEDQIADYYRVTLVSTPKSVQDVKILIQNTFILGNKRTQRCKRAIRKVVIGEQSSRVM